MECSIKDKTLRAYLPNPGRLWELFSEGSRLYLAKNPPSHERKTRYTVVAVEKDGHPVFLHTHLTNRVAQHLIEGGRISGLEGYTIVKPEIGIGRSRFDFLLQKGREKLVLEVKSCTLFGQEIAMFPDAVTARGRKHIMELAELPREGLKGGVLFVVHSPYAKFFLPEYHTDLDFARTFYELRNEIFIQVVAIGWRQDLSLDDRVRLLEIPWNLLKREAHDKGNYMVVLRLKKGCKLVVGSLGEVSFRGGYYVYVGSAMRNLTKRIQRHQRKKKKLFWHIDHLREHAEFCVALPVRSGNSLECDIAKRIKEISDWSIPGFGASDCTCGTHLFGWRNDPLEARSFIETLMYFRIDRLGLEIPKLI